MAHRSLATAVQGPDSGLYILWLTLPRPIRIPVGRLGTLALPAGLYAYVGSAQRRRSARIARHLRPDKPRRWHIDYVRPYGRVVAVSLVDGSREEECRLAQRLADLLGARVAAPRFGASDCRCPGHLLVLPAPRTAREWFPAPLSPISPAGGRGGRGGGDWPRPIRQRHGDAETGQQQQSGDEKGQVHSPSQRGQITRHVGRQHR